MDAVLYCKQEWECILGRPGVNLALQLSKDWADSANALVTTNTPNKPFNSTLKPSPNGPGVNYWVLPPCFGPV